MARITVNPVYDNTTMEQYIDGEGVARVYFIAPVEGYVLHDNRKDYYVLDETTQEEILVLGYGKNSVSVPVTYDFTANSYNIYAVLESEVPADQIFSGGNNAEIM